MRYLFLAAILVAVIPGFLEARDYSLSLVQTVDLSRENTTGVTLRLPFLDGFILAENILPPDALGVPALPDDAERGIRSMSLVLAPLKSLSLYAGALCASGHPSRATRPVFRLSGPFFSPADPSGAVRIQQTTARFTGFLGLLASGGRWTAASLISPEAPEKPSWILVGLHSGGRELNAPRFSLSFLAGLAARDTGPERSWFTDRGTAPDGFQFHPSVEASFRLGCVSGTGNLFFDLSPLTAPSAAFRGELRLSGTRGSLSAGAYLGGNDFTCLGNSRPVVLERLFIAPELALGSTGTGSPLVRAGGMLWRDRIPAGTWSEGSIHRFSGGFGTVISLPYTEISVSAMNPDGIWEYRASADISRIYVRNLGGVLSVYSRESQTGMAVDLVLIVRGGLKASTGMEWTAPTNHGKESRKASLSLKKAWETGRTSFICSAGISGKTGNDFPEAELAIQVSFH